MTKDKVRKTLMTARGQAHGSEGAGPPRPMAAWLQSQLPSGAILGAYQPIRSERDPGPLLDRIDAPLAYPRVMGAGTPLAFFQTDGRDDFEAGSFGVLEPKLTCPTVVPQVLLVPLVGFDRRGYRLGYGGGFYDRTLAKFRKQGPVLAVGFAYDGQLSQTDLDFEDTDLALDAIMTPTRLYEFTDAKVMETPWS